MLPEHVEIRRWVVKARHDWSVARKVFTPSCEETDAVAFHCQQAVEKLLKAYLVSRKVAFEKAHDLGRLLDHCTIQDAQFDTLRDAVEPLTLYAVAFRYPGPAEPTIQEVEAALTVVQFVWDFVIVRLPDAVTASIQNDKA